MKISSLSLRPPLNHSYTKFFLYNSSPSTLINTLYANFKSPPIPQFYTSSLHPLQRQKLNKILFNFLRIGKEILKFFRNLGLLSRVENIAGKSTDEKKEPFRQTRVNVKRKSKETIGLKKDENNFVQLQVS